MPTRPTVSDVDLDAGCHRHFLSLETRLTVRSDLWVYLPKARDPEPGSDHILRERQAALRTYFFTCGVPAAGAFAHLGVREMIIFRKLM